MALVEVRNRNRTATKLSDTAKLESIFPQSPPLPGHPGGAYNDIEVESVSKSLTNGVQSQNPDFLVDLDFGGAPDLSHLANGVVPNDNSPVAPGGQAPAIGSPGAGSFNPLDVPASPGTPQASGAGSLATPGIASPQMATQIGGGSQKNLKLGDSGVIV